MSFGVDPRNPIEYAKINYFLVPGVSYNREPKSGVGGDYDFQIETIWRVGKSPTGAPPLTGNEGDQWMLTKKTGSYAQGTQNPTWVQFIGGSTGSLLSLSDNANTPVFPSTSTDTPPNNIQFYSPNSTVTIVSHPTTNQIALDITGGTDALETLTGNDGVPISSSGTPGNIDILTAGTTTQFKDVAGSLTLNFALSNLLLGSNGSITTGANSCGYGFNSLAATTSGGSNAAFGFNTLMTNVGGSGNSAFGNGALATFNSGTSFTLTHNSAFGNNSLNHLLTGIYNSCFGDGSGLSYVGSESHNLLFANSGVASESHVIRIGTQGSGNGQQNECFIAGIVGNTVANPQYVTINSSTGQLGVESSIVATPVIFQATLSVSSTGGVTGNGANYIIPFDTANVNIGSAFNTSTNTFTAPVTGSYLFTYTICMQNLTSAMTSMKAHIVTTTTGPTSTSWRICEENIGAAMTVSNDSFTGSGSVIVSMLANDTAQCNIFISGAASNLANTQGGSLTTFCGQLIS